MRTLLIAFVVGVLSAPACMVAQYEEVPSDRKRLSSGQEILLVWPSDGDETPPTLFVDYISSAASPTILEQEARDVWAEVRSEAERKDVRRVAIRPTIVERGLKWQDGRPSLWRSSTSTFWHGRGTNGKWTDGDPGVTRERGAAER
jgi:hypothetical protein